ncbi:MAG: alpha-amylase [Balneolales bacterium]|nr:alpha-amylase [Balneolales bacterium]
MNRIILLTATLLVTLLTFSCQTAKNGDHPEFSPPEWSYNATIYEVNIRQFSEEGTFSAVEAHLPRLKELGVDIVWLMPVHPIGEKNRKGTKGSYYAVYDYFDVNPEFGSKDDLRSLIQTAHSLDMKVLLDWVANHTAWDNPLTQTNPDFYVLNEEGDFIIPPDTDWEDVIQLNYDNPAVHDYMASALRYWVEEFDIDGYRADVAYLVPTEFWIRARRDLDAIKPVFMLAEAHTPELHPAFDMGYNWEMHHLMNRIARGESVPNDIDAVLNDVRNNFPENTFMMNFITNHDENSWAGTEFDRLGEGKDAFAVLVATMEGMPLLYNGQETGFNRMLEFFEKDPIDWDFDSKYIEFYTRLNQLKQTHAALQNGARGGKMERVATTANDQIYAFTRSAGDEHILVVLNLSNSIASFEIESQLPSVGMDAFWGDLSFEAGSFPTEHQFGPWEYQIFTSSR